jgi:lipopolysaccharide transport protein LptA
MHRIRILKIALPLALVAFVVVLLYALRSPVKAVQEGAKLEDFKSSQGKEITAVEMHGKRTMFELMADKVEQLDDQISIQGLNEFKFHREFEEPLVIAAELGRVIGSPGERRIFFEKDVVLYDPEDGLEVRISELEYIQAEGLARSKQQLLISGETFHGRASGLQYGVDGPASELYDLHLEDDTGTTLDARKAILLDHLDDVELVDRVRLTTESDHFHARYMRIQRSDEGKLKHLWAAGSIDGSLVISGGFPLQLNSEGLELQCTTEGDPLEIELTGGIRLSKQGRTLTSTSVRAWRETPMSTRWNVEANEHVVLEGVFEDKLARLRADRFEALVEESPVFMLLEGEASGHVSFDGTATRAEADRVTFNATVEQQISLFGTAKRKARLARSQSRISAEEIHTDPSGQRLDALRGVETTLLPSSSGPSGQTQAGIFKNDEAVHFVSNKLSGRDTGTELTFSGDVRGWQGERSLSADKMTLNKTQRRLEATTKVTTRLPRSTQREGVSTSDYIQILADKLDYSEIENLAIFEGSVRMLLEEGWLEADRIEVAISRLAGDIERIEALGQVKLEFREPQDQGVPEVMSGSADRLTYLPQAASILLYGEDQPASIRRMGEGGATTTGRVLRYQLDLGTLEVDSGDTGPMRIITSDD